MYLYAIFMSSQTSVSSSMRVHPTDPTMHGNPLYKDDQNVSNFGVAAQSCGSDRSREKVLSSQIVDIGLRGRIVDGTSPLIGQRGYWLLGLTIYRSSLPAVWDNVSRWSQLEYRHHIQRERDPAFS